MSVINKWATKFDFLESGWAWWQAEAGSLPGWQPVIMSGSRAAAKPQ
jgi:hypothetical protein